MLRRLSLQKVTLMMAAAGFIVGSCFPGPSLTSAAELCAQAFMGLLKLISMPLVFLSIVSSCSRMESLATARALGGRVMAYTITTTLIAAGVALSLYLLLDPAASLVGGAQLGTGVPPAPAAPATGSYWDFLRQALPSHIFEPFLNHNVIGVLFLALLVGGAVLYLPANERATLHKLFASLFALVLQIAQFLLYFLPVAVASFVILFLRDLAAGTNLRSLALYMVCIVAANLIQALLVLPSLLASKGIRPWRLMQAMAPALTLAFFSKSSAAALPMALQCAEERAGINQAVTRFSLPLCTTMNMNACAAFILTTFLYVSRAHGVEFSTGELLSWVVIASIAAMGNAAVPMGCYFLASSFLAAQQVPLALLGVILPFYTLLDMLETAINVWSDACVTAVVARDLEQSAAGGFASAKPESI